MQGTLSTLTPTATVSLLIATLVFGLSFLACGLPIVPFLLVLFLFGIALGISATAIVLRFGPAAECVVWPIPAILSPFAAVFYPLTISSILLAARLFTGVCRFGPVAHTL